MPTIAESRKRAIDERLQAHKISDTEYNVYNTLKKTQYAVLKSKSGYWTCNCQFMTKGSHVGTQGVCKHITRVKDREEGCGKSNCRADKLCPSCLFTDRMLS